WSWAAWRSVCESARSGDPRRIATDWAVAVTIVRLTIMVDAANLKGVLFMTSTPSIPLGPRASGLGRDPRRERFDFGDGGQRAVERAGHDLLRRAPGHPTGETQPQVTGTVETQGEGGLATVRGAGAPRQRHHFRLVGAAGRRRGGPMGVGLRLGVESFGDGG